MKFGVAVVVWRGIGDNGGACGARMELDDSGVQVIPAGGRDIGRRRH